MAKIALDLEHALARRARDASKAATASRIVASGDGYAVADVLCTCGPGDAAFEERHGAFCIALVVAGAFEYRCATGHGLMTPGAVLLGNAGECFECGHRHRAGDRCIAFRYRPEFFERLFADAGYAGRAPSFSGARIEPARELASFVAAAGAGVAASANRPELPWDELALSLAVRVLRHLDGARTFEPKPLTHGALARVVDTLRWIDQAPDAALDVPRLAEHAGLSPYHFLRTFERATGVTPHQYVLRARLRHAAQALADASDKVVDIAFACGFADLSNFNRAFRAEFGVAPRAYRKRWQR